MICSQDVIKLFMPYYGLAYERHMYVQTNDNERKRELLSIQRIKNKHLTFGYPVDNYKELYSADDDNPCVEDSFIDLEKLYLISDVFIPESIKADSNIDDSLFDEIISGLAIKTQNEILTEDFLDLNKECNIIFN